MASTIQIKNSTTAGNTPGSLSTGELAINVADGNLFYGSASNVHQDFVFGNITASNASFSTFGAENEIVLVGPGSSITSSDALSIDSAGNVGIGTSSPAVRLHMVGEGDGTSQIRMDQYNPNDDAPDLRARRAKGTEASPQDIVAGNYLFRFNVEGYSGSAFTTYGSMQFDTDTSDVNAMVWNLDTRDSDQNVTSRLKIDKNGHVSASGDLAINGINNVSASIAEAAESGGGGTPGGSDGEVQINNGGNFNGYSSFFFNKNNLTPIITLQSDNNVANFARFLISGSNNTAGSAELQLDARIPRVYFNETITPTEVYIGALGGKFRIDNDSGLAGGIEFDVDGGADSIKSKALNSTSITASIVSASTYTASVIYAADMGAGVDNSVVIKDADGVLKTDEIDGRVWGNTLVDATSGVNNRIPTFTDNNSLIGEANLTFDSTNLTFREGGIGGHGIIPSIGQSFYGKTGQSAGVVYDLPSYWSDYTGSAQAPLHQGGEYLRGFSPTLGKTGFGAPVSLGKGGAWEQVSATGKQGTPGGLIGLWCGNPGTSDNLALLSGLAMVSSSKIGGTGGAASNLYLATASTHFYQVDAPKGSGTTARKVGTIINVFTGGKAGNFALVRFNPSGDFITN